jgi:putative SOS response-associated peptidase YedK
MCGRFTQTATQKSLLNRFLVKILSSEIEQQMRPRYNLAPSQDAFVITSAGSSETRELQVMKWGLIPSWSKNSALQLNTINARAESVKESPVFREPFTRSRCIVPATGFFEWKAGSSPKQPYYIYPADSGELFAFAGLWDRWSGPDGQTIRSFTIMTTSANGLMEPIHHRMPVILADRDYSMWLGEEPCEMQRIEALLKPAAEVGMVKHKVSTFVNKVKHDTPETIQPFEPLEWDF